MVLIHITFSIDICYLTLAYPFLGYVFEYLPLSPLQVCGFSLIRFREFRVSCQWYFYSPSVEVLGNFWIVRGVIDRFTKLHRKIY